MPRKEKNKKLKQKIKPRQKQKQKQSQNINIVIDQSKKTNPRQQQAPKPPSYTGPNVVYTPSPIIQQQQPVQQIPIQSPVQQPPAQYTSLDTDRLIEAFKNSSNNNINTLTDAMRNNTNYLANGISGTTSYLNDNLEQQGKYIENHLNNLFQKFYNPKQEQEIKPGTILVDDKGIGHSTLKKDSYKTPTRTIQIEEPFQLTPSLKTISDNVSKARENSRLSIDKFYRDAKDLLGEDEFKTILEMGQTPKKPPSSIQKALEKVTEETKIDEPLMDFIEPSPKQEKETDKKTEPEVVEDVRRWDYTNDTEVKLDKTNKLICNICGNTYTDAQNLKEHIKKHHTTNNPDQEFIKITLGPTAFRREYEAFLPTQLKQYNKNIDAYIKEV